MMCALQGAGNDAGLRSRADSVIAETAAMGHEHVVLG